MLERRSKLLGLGCLAHDLVLTALALPIAYLLRVYVLPRIFDSHFLAIYPLHVYLPFLFGVLVTWTVVGFLYGIYRRVELRNPAQIIGDETKLVVTGMVLVHAGLYLFRADVSRSLAVTFGAVNLLLLISGRLILFFTKGSLRRIFGRYHHILVVGTGEYAHELARLVEHAEPLGLRLIGFAYLTERPPAPIQDLHSSYTTIPFGQVAEFIHDHVVDEVLIAVDKQDLDCIEPLVLHCEREGIRTRVHLNFLKATSSSVHLEHFNEFPLLTFSTGPQDELQLLAKRFADTALAALLLFLLAPLLLVIALLVRLTSPGPVLYRQTRCGLGGRRFTVLKFRSMVQNAEQLRAGVEHLNEADGPVFKIAADPRVTPIGRWLRRTSLDELPQLWNILRGDMSFVGPRPPIPEEVEKYESWQRRRLRMRPGLTCLWALEGRSQLNFDRWMQLDLSYIDRWSLWLDAQIFLKTIPHVLFGRGAW
ncbi:MAG: sugar transferase [Acidobacteria bacterium]|nr:MAG: sugar transferase [Acidobacteriota bacterium]